MLGLGSAQTRSWTYRWDVLVVLVQKDFRIRYKNTLLGYAWSLLHPLAFAAVFFFVFQKIIWLRVENYALFLLTGLFSWQWFANSVSSSCRQFSGNAGLIRKMRFPHWLLVLAAAVGDMIHFLASIPVIVLLVLYYGEQLRFDWLWQVPLLGFVQLLLTTGLCLLIATANVFLRDVERIVGIGVLLAFYATPIIYPTEMIPAEYAWTIMANPMSALTTCWRGVFLEGAFDWSYFSAASLAAVLMFAIGLAVYRRSRWRFAEVV